MGKWSMSRTRMEGGAPRSPARRPRDSFLALLALGLLLAIVLTVLFTIAPAH